jgi:ATP-binding cassette subfamily C protein LapB
VLDAVDRILVVDGGAVVLDGPRDQVMARLRQGAAASRETTALAGRGKEAQA